MVWNRPAEKKWVFTNLPALHSGGVIRGRVRGCERWQATSNTRHVTCDTWFCFVLVQQSANVERFSVSRMWKFSKEMTLNGEDILATVNTLSSYYPGGCLHWVKEIQSTAKNWCQEYCMIHCACHNHSFCPYTQTLDPAPSFFLHFRFFFII